MKNIIANYKENFTVSTVDGKTTAIANWTKDNVDTAINIINTVSDKSDYSKAVIAFVMVKTAEKANKDKKEIKKVKEDLCISLRVKDTAVLDKYVAVADNFLTIDNNLLTAKIERDENGDIKPTLDVNFKAVHALKDKYGFEFSLGALQEMLWLKNEKGELDVDKLTQLITDGKLKASMPNCNPKTGIRAVINENKYKANTDGNTEGNTEGNTDGNTEGNTEGNSDKETIVFTKTSEKERMIAIQNIVNGFTEETINAYPMFKEFVEFIPNFIANCK